LARLRAYDDLYELDEADLRFSHEEMRAFLQQALHFPLSAATIARLEARMEGWVTGLHLLALALQGRKDPQELEPMLVTSTGGHARNSCAAPSWLNDSRRPWPGHSRSSLHPQALAKPPCSRNGSPKATCLPPGCRWSRRTTSWCASSRMSLPPYR